MSRALVLAGFMVLQASPAVAGDASDAWITTQVKIALVTAPNVNGTSVHVDTIDGTVILYGKVRTASEKAAAKEIAARSRGAKRVQDLLQVVPAMDEARIKRGDEDIRLGVQHLLDDDKGLSAGDMSVKSVNHGVVLLQGTARNLTDYLAVVEVVRAAPGVRGVASEVASSELLSDLQPPPSAVASQHDPQPSRVRDAWLTASVKMRLLADGEVPALDIGVETRAGVVTLFGAVPTEQARSAAEADALKADASGTINNEIQVVPAARKKAVHLQDDALKRNVVAAFKKSPELSTVDVSVNNSVVHLTGKVASEWLRLRAATTARSTAGVHAVDDDLQVDKGPSGT
jgi:hyperosmotically inducible protein